jgi:hypothetical protein
MEIMKVAVVSNIQDLWNSNVQIQTTEAMSMVMITTRHKTTLTEIKVIGTTTDTSSLPAITYLKITEMSSKIEKDVNIRTTMNKTTVEITVVKTLEIIMRDQYRINRKHNRDIHNKDKHQERMKIISTKHRELKEDHRALKFILILQRLQSCKILAA